jgi:hypothetical protein
VRVTDAGDHVVSSVHRPSLMYFLPRKETAEVSGAANAGGVDVCCRPSRWAPKEGGVRRTPPSDDRQLPRAVTVVRIHGWMQH